jgi:signal transduction histidine kinase/ActR/RegA family two-component response regulator
MKHRAYLSKTSSLLQVIDWSSTPLGSPDKWPVSLRGFVSMVMSMPTPAILFWGSDLTQIYNDGYAEIMGPRHPRYFGAPYRMCWPETYALIYPWMRRVLDHAEVVEVQRERIPLTRLGFEEDAYFTFTFSPLRDDSGRIAGILQPVFEVTDSVLAERRASVLRALATVSVRPDPWTPAIAILTGAMEDIPEAAICELDHNGGAKILEATAGCSIGTTGEDDLANLIYAAEQADRRGDEALHTVVLPLSDSASRSSRKFLVAATNPRLRADTAYAQFMEMVGAELSAALKRIEAATAEERQHAHLNRLFMQAPAGIAVLRGPTHVFELINPLYRALIGHRDIRGLPLSEALPELVGQPFSAILDRVYLTGEPYVGLAEPVLLARERGSAMEQAFFNYVYQPLHDVEQRPEGILVFCYEVTDQVLARQHAEQLTQALRLEHRRKDEFLAMLAHELRNPLAPISSASDLLLCSAHNANVVEQASRIIGRQVRHLSGLIDDLLDVSRVTRGLVVLDRESQDLRAVLLASAEQARPLIASRSHGLRMDLPPPTMFVLGDHKRLVQIFSNLLNNAAKYTPDGGQITLSLQATDVQAIVTVSDTGIGIEAHMLARMFDLFVQGERGADRAAGGLGIGLSLVRSLVEMHGGSVEAESKGPGLGSCFRVRLPTLAPSSDDVPSDDVLGDMCRGRGEPVLVVDDNVDAAKMLALQVEAVGYSTEVTHTGHGAVRACAQRQYLACLVDIGLPDLHGVEVVRRIKSGPVDDCPLLLAVSGYGQQADMNLAREAGFDHYFVKPVDIAALASALHERAEKRR